jgi:sec-independent protein translocase protein TatA
MNSTLLIFNLGGPEIILIVLVVLLLFGGRKIPELMKGLGKGIKEFNSAKANIESEIKENIREIEEPKKEAILERKSNED